MESLFLEISVVMVLALVLSIIAKALRQPIIIAYLLTGILVPLLLGSVQISSSSLDAFSQMGIAFLLFIVGVNLNLDVIKRLGIASIAAGILQMLATAAVIFLALQLISVQFIPALFLAVALSFSSTAVVVKLLWDKGDTWKLYGQLATGILIVQDIVAVLVLLIIASFSPSTPFNVGQSIILWMGIVALLFVATSYVLPAVTKTIARSQELLFIFTICWCFFIASLFYIVGIGIEIGALVAGLSLSTSAFHYEIAARIKPLRDFFLIIYFFALGVQMSSGVLTEFVSLIAILIILTMLAKVLFTFIGLRLLGYNNNISLHASLCLSQVSEFSFILAGVGVAVGYLQLPYMAVATAVGIITIALSSYLIQYSDAISQVIFGVRHQARKQETKAAEMILLGYNRIGYDLLNSLQHISTNYLVIDYNPDIVADLRRKNVPVIYGDASDTDFLSSINFSKSKLVISTIPDLSTNILILDRIKSTSKKNPVFIAIAHKIDDALALYNEGADYVILPHFLGAHYVSSLIEKYGPNKDKFKAEREKHLTELEARRILGHEHPVLDFKI
ncbi:MAG: cation:proton antiporter [Candidatus Micrarchaeia archaeon]